VFSSKAMEERGSEHWLGYTGSERGLEVKKENFNESTSPEKGKGGASVGLLIRRFEKRRINQQDK